MFITSAVLISFIFSESFYHASNIENKCCCTNWLKLGKYFILFQSLDPPQYVYWHHNNKIINYERMNRVSVQTDPGPKTHSRLIINKVDKEDSGNYTCSAPNTESSSIDVFVSPGKI